MRTLIISVFVLALWSSLTLADTIIPGGPVAGTWDLAGSPYLVQGNITLQGYRYLTIDPGVDVIFQGHYKFIVYGVLQAIGTETDSITFTAANTSGGWHGLRFYDLSSQLDSSRLVYCVLEYGRSSTDNSAVADKNGGAIYALRSSKLLIDHCFFAFNQTADMHGEDGVPGDPGTSGQSVVSGSGGAIYLSNSDIMLKNSVFYRNHTGIAIGGTGGYGTWTMGSYNVYGHDGGVGGDGDAGKGGALFVEQSDPLIMNNIFSECGTGDGIGGEGGRGGDADNTGTAGIARGGTGGDGGAGSSGSGGAIYFDGTITVLINNLFGNCSGGDGYGGDGGDGGDGYFLSDVSQKGKGGNGGNGYGGDGMTIFTLNSDLIVSNITAACIDTARGFGGTRGRWGEGSEYWTYTPPNDGAGFDGIGVLNSMNGTMEISSIILQNCLTEDNLVGDITATYSCIEGGYPGIGNINSDPIFIISHAGDYFLSQRAAGQRLPSPCVDAGDPDALMIVGTTRTDSVLDMGIIDMGYHYFAENEFPYMSVNPTNLIHEYAIGAPPQFTDTLTLVNLSSGSFNFSAISSVPWMTLVPNSGGPVPPAATLIVTIDATGLLPMIHNGEIRITSEEAINSPLYIPVSLEVGEAALWVYPYYLNFSTSPGFDPDPDIFSIFNNGSGYLNYTIEENIDWLSILSPMSGQVPPADTITAYVDVSGMWYGSHTGEIIVRSSWGTGSPDTVDVNLVISQPVLTVSEDTLNVMTTWGYNPNPQCTYVMNIGPGYLNFNIEEDVEWFDVSPDSSINPLPPNQALIVTIESAEFLPGNYSGVFTILSEGSIGSPLTIPVNLNVLADLSGSIEGVFLSGLEYNVIGDISVDSGDSLLIQPGANLVFDGNYSFTVNGYLNAVGSISDSIKFIPSGSYGSWGNLIFTDSSDDSSRLEYCLINRSSGIILDHANPTIGNCTISQSYGTGLKLINANSQLENCEFIDNSSSNDAGGAISIIYGSDLQISDCLFESNTSNVDGGAIHLLVGCGLILDRCTFVENHAGEKGGALFRSFSSIEMNDCNFVGNSAPFGGAMYSYYGNQILNRCLFLENFADTSGGAIDFAANTEFAIDRCTFSGNSAGFHGSAIYIFTESVLDLFNSVISGNVDQPAIEGVFESTNINYNCLSDNPQGDFSGSGIPTGLGILSQTNANGDSCDVYHNIFMDPLFYSTSGDSAYRLTDLSPCIDAGNPLSPLDPDSTIADMGTYYFDQGLGVIAERPIEIPDEFCLLPAYPNPFNPSTTIRFGLPVASQVRLFIYNIRGEKVADLVDGFRLPGYHSVTWEAQSLASGIYFAVIQAGDFQSIRKVMLVK